MNDNYRAVAGALELSPDEIVRLAKNSFAASFLKEHEKQARIDAVTVQAENLRSA